MPGANHCRDPFLALGRIGWRVREGPDATSPGEPKGRFHCFILGMCRGVSAVRLLDPRAPQLVGEPPFAVTARAQRTRLGQRKSCIVYQPELGEPCRDRLEVRLAVAGPSALADFAREIIAQFR